MGKRLPEVAFGLGHEKILVQLDIFDEIFNVHAKEKVTQIFLLHDVVIEYFDGIDQFFFVVWRVHELHALTFLFYDGFVMILLNWELKNPLCTSSIDPKRVSLNNFLCFFLKV